VPGLFGGRSARCAARSNTRCRDACKPDARISRQIGAVVDRTLPAWAVKLLNNDVSQYVGVLSLFAFIIGSVLTFVYFQVSFESDLQRQILRSTLWTVFFILGIIAGIAAWLFVLVHESRRVAEEESPPPDRTLDAGDRRPQAHRRQAAAGQGKGRGGEQGQEPLCGRAQPRAAHAP